MWLNKHLLPWDRLPACPLLLEPDRLEAYPTCLGVADHAQTDLHSIVRDGLMIVEC